MEQVSIFVQIGDKTYTFFNQMAGISKTENIPLLSLIKGTPSHHLFSFFLFLLKKKPKQKNQLLKKKIQFWVI